MIVSEIPGTTRDSIDTVLERGGRTFVLIDTAGLRRKRRHRQGIEYYSELRALESAERADVALVLIDASEGVVDQDLAVADVARKADNSTLIVLSKWDVTTVRIEDVRGMLRRRLRQRPPFLAISAHTGRGLDRLLDTVVDLFDRHIARIPTPELNDFLQELRNRAPASGAKRQAPQPALRHADATASAAHQDLRQRPDARDAGLRLLGRERDPRALRPRRRPCLDRLRPAHVRFLVVGAGSWGTAFTRVLLDRGHDVVLACHTAEQARGDLRDGTQPALPRAGRPPRRRGAVTVDDAPADVDAIVVAVPSKSFAEVVAALPGDAPVLSLTKGLDPADGRAALDDGARPRRSPFSPARTSPGRSHSACRPRR